MNEAAHAAPEEGADTLRPHAAPEEGADTLRPHAALEEGAGTLRLPVEVTFATAPAVLEQALTAFGAGTRWFDLSDCERFDSSLIGVLLELRRRAHAADARCGFVRPSTRLLELAGLYGVEPLLFAQAA